MNRSRLLSIATQAIAMLLSISPVSGQESRLLRTIGRLRVSQTLQVRQKAPNTHPQLFRTAPAHLPASANPNVMPANCPPEADSAVCGYVNVPLDRKHPDREQIPIYFELYMHT